MDLGTLLVIVGLVLAVVAAFLDRAPNFRLLCGAVVLVALGVLVGAEGFMLR